MAKIPALEHLRSGIILTRGERDIVRREISDLETAVELGKKEVSRFQEHLEHEKTLANYRALFAPIRLLPPEVLGEIFVYFKPSLGSEDDASLYPVMRLSLVCNTWRRFLLNIPEFWTFICIPRRPNAQFASLLQLQFTRSSSLPLKLSMSMYHKDFIDVLHASLHRFERLLIAIPRHLPLLSGLNTVDNILKEIRLNFDPTREEEFLPLVTVAAPKLESVILLCYRGCWTHGRVGLPWSQLTRLELGGRFGQDTLGVLGECNNLLELITYLSILSSDVAEDSFPSRRVVVPLLRTWKHLAFGSIFVDLALDTLVLPNLRTLHFDSPPLPKLLSLAERSSCALEWLRIDAQSEVPEEAQVQLVESLPSLRTFIHVVRGSSPNLVVSSGVHPRVAELLAARRLRQDALYKSI